MNDESLNILVIYFGERGVDTPFCNQSKFIFFYILKFYNLDFQFYITCCHYAKFLKCFNLELMKLNFDWSINSITIDRLS